MIKIAPSILSADFANLERDIRRRRRAEDRDDADDGPAGGDGEPDADGKPRASDGDGSRS